MGGLALVALMCASCSGGIVFGGHPRGPRHEDARAVDVPPGHMPPPGECRVWYPDAPPGHQPLPSDCDEAMATAPRGTWVIYRPDGDKRVVRLR